jgi:glycosyltransferase involved in cell wall biosynthesis
VAERLAVAVDARRLQDQPLGGVGRWVANILPLLAADADLTLLTDARRPPVGGGWSERALRVPGSLPETAWLQVSAARWLRGFGGVFHGTFNMLPALCRLPSVVSIYDLAPRQHREDQSLGRQAVWRPQMRLAAHQAKRIVTISDFSRDSIVRLYRIDPDKVVIARPAVDPAFGPDRAEEAGAVLERLGVGRPYVVAVGGARRRGLEVAVGAWRQARAAGAEEDLVVVGAEAPPAEPGLHHAGPLDDAGWAALLAGAEALCYPTRYEGYGMPALEAAASGTPVVAARLGALPEVLGDAAAWVDAPTVDAVAAALTALLGDPDRRERLRAAGLARAAAAPGWDVAAATVLDAYRHAAGSAA